MTSDINESEKAKRLYLEVRHVRNCCLTFPKQSDIFKLKKNYKTLPAHVLNASNLKVYLQKLSCHVDMNMKDFSNAMKKLA